MLDLRHYKVTKIILFPSLFFSTGNVVQQLELYLGRVKEISGFLKITRTYSIVSLDFFKSLEKISGIRVKENNENKQKYYSIYILENENLAKLFTVENEGRPNEKTVQIYKQNGNEGRSEAGEAFIHYNAKLCKSEIEQMLAKSNMLHPGSQSQDISFATNGNKAVCSPHKLAVSIIPNGAELVMVFFDNYQEKIAKVYPETADYRSLLGYQINYRSISKATFKAKNMTKYEGRDACGGDEWMVSDHIPSGPKISADGLTT